MKHLVEYTGVRWFFIAALALVLVVACSQAYGDDTYTPLQTCHEGLWYDPVSDGEGFSLAPNNGRIFMIWYTYQPNGSATWAVGDEQIHGVEASGPLIFLMQVASPKDVMQWRIVAVGEDHLTIYADALVQGSDQGWHLVTRVFDAVRLTPRRVDCYQCSALDFGPTPPGC
jgi:hypothetical protein